MSTKFLIFTDAHVEPGCDLSRFSWLGEKIVEHRPDYVAQLGDFCSMLSLSHWDRNKRLLMEGRRFREDMQAVEEAISLMMRPITMLQENQRANKKKQYKPSLIWCDGNHEEWVDRYIEQHPELDGQLNTVMDYVKDYTPCFSSVSYVPYKEYFKVGNIAFTHAPIQANSQPVSGKYATHRALDLFDCSIVFGHTHKFEVVNRYQHGADSTKQSVAAGCFFDHQPAYSRGAANDYYRCAILLTERDDGVLDVETLNWE